MNKKRSSVWLNFNVEPNDKARCVFCQSLFSYKGGSTSNLRKHISSKHPHVKLLTENNGNSGNTSSTAVKDQIMTGWNKEESTFLIDMLKQYPCLYDPRDNDHSKRDIRHKALVEISKAMEKYKPNIQPSEVKQKIRTLRNQYSKEKSTHMKSLKNENGEEYIPKLWCYNELSFLSDHLPAPNESDLLKIAVESLDTNFVHVDENYGFETMEETMIDSEKLDTDALQEVIENPVKRKKTNSYREGTFLTYLGELLPEIKLKENYDETTWQILNIVQANIRKDRKQRDREQQKSRYSG